MDKSVCLYSFFFSGETGNILNSNFFKVNSAGRSVVFLCIYKIYIKNTPKVINTRCSINISTPFSYSSIISLLFAGLLDFLKTIQEGNIVLVASYNDPAEQ